MRTDDLCCAERDTVVTLVLRLWRAESGGTSPSGALRFQATHVQSGEVAYFRTMEGVLQHIERSTHRLTVGAANQQPIDLFRKD
jgi:hypothetical protein